MLPLFNLQENVKLKNKKKVESLTNFHAIVKLDGLKFLITE